MNPSKNKLIFDAFGVIDLHLGAWSKMSDTDELFVFHSLMAATWRQWSWDMEVAFSNVA